MELLNLTSEPKQTQFLKDIPFKYERYDNGYLIPSLGSKKWDGHIFISGATGAGKSWMIKLLCMNDKKRRDIVIFTDLDNEDESFKELYESGRTMKPEEAEEENKESPYDNKIVIFDDCTKCEKGDVIEIRDHLLEKGRHKGTMVICVNHKLREWRNTMKPLNEARYVILFPSANKLAVMKFLETMGLKRKEQNAIINLSNDDGRYLIYHQFFPNALITQRTVMYV